MNEHARFHVDTGVDVGSPDLLIYTRYNDITHFFFLELKTTTGKLKPDQKEWNAVFDADYKSANCTRSVAYGYDDAIQQIEQWAAKFNL